MKKNKRLILILAIAISACASEKTFVEEGQTASYPSYPDSAPLSVMTTETALSEAFPSPAPSGKPVQTYLPPAEPADPSNPFAPLPGDEARVKDNIQLTLAEVTTAKGVPPSYSLILKGFLPTPCHALRVVKSPPNATNEVNIAVYSVVDPQSICSQVLNPFDVNVPMDLLPPGTYAIWVNGQWVAEIQF
ncbi:MAG: hypothetical protein HXY38_09415 [Chloroflexi bacterium]|nr:hypothetical protein [Chloroflexota bacterium]